MFSTGIIVEWSWKFSPDCNGYVAWSAENAA